MPAAGDVVDDRRLDFVLRARPDLVDALRAALRRELGDDPARRLAALGDGRAGARERVAARRGRRVLHRCRRARRDRLSRARWPSRSPPSTTRPTSKRGSSIGCSSAARSGATPTTCPPGRVRARAADVSSLAGRRRTGLGVDGHRVAGAERLVAPRRGERPASGCSRRPRELDFEPNMLASGLARNRTQVVAVIVHDVMDEYFSEIARGIEDEAYANGYVTRHLQHRSRSRQGGPLPPQAAGAAGRRDPVRRRRGARPPAPGRGRPPARQGRGGRRRRSSGWRRFRAGGPTSATRTASASRSPSTTSSSSVTDRIGFLAGPPGIATSTERLTAMRRAMKRHGLTLPGRA